VISFAHAKSSLKEIEDKHFIPPCSTDSVESDYEVDAAEAQNDCEFSEQLNEVSIADVEDTITDEITTDEQVSAGIRSIRLHRVDEKNANYQENSELDDNSEDQADNRQLPLDAELNSEPMNVDSTFKMRFSSSSFDDSIASYLYLNISQANRIRASSTGSLPTAVNSSTIPTSSSLNSLTSTSKNYQRRIANQCAICLCDYNRGDTIVISSNTSCPHAFHQECIVEWLVKMQEGTPCPCCRQTFVELETIENTNPTGRNRRREIQMSEEELGALRRHLQLGLQRGRAFDTSVIRF
jgi:hypothetical protein